MLLYCVVYNVYASLSSLLLTLHNFPTRKAVCSVQCAVCMPFWRWKVKKCTLGIHKIGLMFGVPPTYIFFAHRCARSLPLSSSPCVSPLCLQFFFALNPVAVFSELPLLLLFRRIFLFFLFLSNSLDERFFYK